MVSEVKAKHLVQQADAIKSSNQQKAKEMYLRAAEMFLHLSEVLNDKKYLEEAEKTFKKTQSLSPPSQFGENQIDINKMMVEKPKLKFKDVGGLKDLKEEIYLKVIAPLKFPKVYNYFNKKIGGGILMYGPPGCGKSLIAEATAGEADVAYFHVKASDLKSKYVGETERNIAKLFETARENQPCVIFFDEFEALGEERTSASPQNKGAVSQLLTEMNGLGTKDDQILLIAATNEPWAIDIALRREGRFGTTLFIPPPDEIAREEILKLELKDKPTKNIDYKKIAELTEGFSGADMGSIINHAIEKAIKEVIITKKVRPITTEDLLSSLTKKKSSITPWFNHALSTVFTLQMEDSFPELKAYQSLLTA